MLHGFLPSSATADEATMPMRLEAPPLDKVVAAFPDLEVIELGRRGKIEQ